MPNTPTFRAGDKIPLKTAEEYTSKWQKAPLHEKAKYADMKGWLIPKEDIEGLYKTKNLDGARAYLGIDPVSDKLKLLMVAVQKVSDTEYKDVIGSEDDADIYDFTRPCPDQCDCLSPLNGGTCEIGELHVQELHEVQEA